MKKLKTGDKEEIIRRVGNGETRKAMAIEYGVSVTHIGRLILRYLDANEVDDNTKANLTNRRGYNKKRAYIESIEHLSESVVVHLVKAWEDGYATGYNLGRHQ